MPPKRKQSTDLKPGQYPTTIRTMDTSNEVVTVPTVSSLPKEQRLTPQPQLLSNHLLPMFEEMNIRGQVGLNGLLTLVKNAAWKYPTLRAFWSAWTDINEPQLLREIDPTATEPTLELACAVAKLSEEDFVGDIHKAIYWYGLEGARQKLQANLGVVVDAAYETATLVGREGHADRKLIFEAAKLIESGPGVVINNNNESITNHAHIGLPQWSDQEKYIQDALLLSPKSANPQQEVIIDVEPELEPVVR